jgi:thiol-disulfide isomerase/thioredoxin
MGAVRRRPSRDRGRAGWGVLLLGTEGGQFALQVGDPVGGAGRRRLLNLRGCTAHAALNVWAFWCGPCRKKMPGFQQVYLKAKDKVGFLGLDSRDVVAAARRFADQAGVTYRLAADPQGQAAAKLGVAALPTTVFTGADGTLRGRRVGALTPSELRANISRYLGVSVP